MPACSGLAVQSTRSRRCQAAASFLEAFVAEVAQQLLGGFMSTSLNVVMPVTGASMTCAAPLGLVARA